MIEVKNVRDVLTSIQKFSETFNNIPDFRIELLKCRIAYEKFNNIQKYSENIQNVYIQFQSSSKN